jgi:hypothetical protein
MAKKRAEMAATVSSSSPQAPAARPVGAGAAPKATKGVGVDMWAHNGLRGAAAVWIVIFHCYGLPKRSELQLNLQGAWEVCILWR